MDLLIQKSTELGVRHIRPIITERSIIKLRDDRAEKRRAHWQRVAISACEQCGRARVPDIGSPDLIATVCDQIDESSTQLMLDPDGGDMPESELAASRSVALLVGPEAGLTSVERETAVRAGFRAVRVGPRILRTETAPLAALSIIQYLSGDFLGR